MTETAPFAVRPGAGRLQDFEPLLPAELIVLRAAAAGSIAKVSLRRPRNPTSDPRVRAEFLGFLARGGGAGAPVAGRLLQILGASIVGRLDLASATVPMSLWLYRCLFSAVPVLENAHIAGSLSFVDCALLGLRADGCHIDGELALSAGCNIDGDVHLAHTHIGRDLNCERLSLRGDSAEAGVLRQRLIADAAQIGGDVKLGGGFEAMGEVRFVAARIAGSLCADMAHIAADIDASGARGVALDLDRVQVGASVCLNRGFTAAGQVRMQQARIDGDFDASGAAFDAIGDASWGDNSAVLLLARAHVGGTLDLRELQGPLQGASLADAQVGTLLDDAATWGQRHVLDGFSYGRLGDGAPTDAAMRLDWLGRQDTRHLGTDFRPDPWRRLIGVLRRMGRHGSAREVAIGREHHLRSAGLIGQSAPRALRWAAQLGHDVFGALAGYGYRPLRLLATAASIWLLCGAAYWAAAEHGGIAPSPITLAVDARLASCRPECSQLPITAPRFQPLLYSLDVLLPGVDLQQTRHWAPARHALGGELEALLGAPPLRLLTAFEALCGWLIAAGFFAIALRLHHRDRSV